jgi:hypothetical protein
MAAASIAAATMASAQKWLPVATTTYPVTAGWTRISQRQRLLLLVMTAQATSSDHATWTEGMADSWSAPAVEPTAA